MQTLAEARCDQLEEAGVAMEKTRLEAEVLRAQLEDFQARLKSSDAQVQELEKALQKSREEWRLAFLQSKEFTQAVDDRDYSFFETSFNM